MKKQPILLAAAAALAFGGATSSHAATVLLQNNGYPVATTQLHYDFNNANKNVWEAVTTDASGNGRVMTGGNDVGTKWGGTGEIIVTDNAYSYTLSNAAGMPGDNYQASIHLTPEPTFGGGSSNMVVYDYDGVSLSYISGAYTAIVNGNTVGTYTAGSAGIMIQKMNGQFSLWSTAYSVDGTATWTQQGSEFTSATSGDDFSGLHMFVKPGGGNVYWGYVGDVKVQSFAVPEPTATALGLLALGGLALRRRRA